MSIYIEMADGVQKIHDLQMHENQEIYKKSYQIVDKYFNDGDEEATGLEPQVDASGAFTFAADGMALPQGGFQFNSNQPQQ